MRRLNFFSFCLCLAISAALPRPGLAATYYIDAVRGDDSNPGTSAAPWRTMAKAESSAVNGSTVYLRNGNYGEVSINKIGLNRSSWDDGIMYIADLGANPVFDKLAITGFENRYLTFESISIIAPSTSSYTAMVYIKDTSNIHFIDCNITGRFVDDGSGGLTSYGIWIDGANNKINDVLLDGCDIQGAGTGIKLAHEMGDSVVIKNNHVHLVTDTLLSISLENNNHGEILIENNHLHDRRKAPGSHGSGIALRASDITIRNNIIHDFGGSGSIRFYGNVEYPDGYKNMIVENNLCYDGQGVTNAYFGSMKENITIINNTFIGYYSGSGVTKYTCVMALNAQNASFGVPNLKVYNNIFVGGVGIKSNMGDYQSFLEEDNNIFWAVRDEATGSYLTQPLGANSIIIVDLNGYNAGYDENYFEGSGNFFVGGWLFDQYSYKRVYNSNPNYQIDSSHKQNLNDAYKLAAGSPGIGFADPAHAPATDLLGNPRDSQPDAGCYEYIAGNQAPTANAGPDQAITDADENGSEQVTLDGSGSRDPDGTIQSYSWTEGGTQIAAGVSPTVTLNVGQHTVTLTVTDNGGLTHTDTVTITVDSPPVTYTLTISASNGSVTKTPDQASYSYGETVSLEAVPDSGYSFASWAGDLSGSTNPATITMDADKTVTANFSANSYTLTVSASNGSVTQTPDQTSYSHGETVTLEAVPDSGYRFTGWSGDLSGSTNPATITMDADKTVTANFSANSYTLTISASNGSVTKTPDQASYSYGETVSLEAVPDSGYSFTGWSGDLSGSTNPATITMDADKTVTANFSASEAVSGVWNCL